MPTWMERDYKNGKVAIYVDGGHTELIVVDLDGDVHEFHCEGSSARLDELLGASEDDEFEPDALRGWDPGLSFDINIKPVPWVDDEQDDHFDRLEASPHEHVLYGRSDRSRPKE